MATVYLGWTEKKFWSSYPKKLISMIKSWKEIEKEKAYYFAALNNGQPIDGPKKRSPTVEATTAQVDALFF